MRISSNSTASFTSSRVVSPTSISPGRAPAAAWPPGSPRSPPRCCDPSPSRPPPGRCGSRSARSTPPRGGRARSPSTPIRPDDRERGPDTSHRVVVVRDRLEDPEHGVSDERLGPAAESRPYLVGDHAVKGRHDLPEPFRIEPRGEVGRPREIDEQDSDDPAFGCRRERDRRAAVRTELGVGGKRLMAPERGRSRKAHASSIGARPHGSEVAARRRADDPGLLPLELFLGENPLGSQAPWFPVRSPRREQTGLVSSPLVAGPSPPAGVHALRVQLHLVVHGLLHALGLAHVA